MTGECTPLVSVVMVFHDACRFLEEAVASVRAQSFPDWELVLVDDGSGDGSREIAESLVAADSRRIRLLQHPGRRNQGIGASRVLAVSSARGELLTFLDADDVYLPARLERHVDLLRRHPEVALVQSRVEYWHSWSNGAAGMLREDELEAPLPLPSGQAIEPPHLLVLLLRSRGHTAPAVCSLTVRAADVRRVGGFESSFRSAYEDQVLLAKLYLECRTFVIDDVLARYRQHPDSVVHRQLREGAYAPGWPNPAEAAFLDWLSRHIGARGGSSLALGEALRAARKPYDRPWAWRLSHLPALSMRAARRVAQVVLPAALLEPIFDMRRRQKERAASRRARAEGRCLARVMDASRSPGKRT